METGQTLPSILSNLEPARSVTNLLESRIQFAGEQVHIILNQKSKGDGTALPSR